MVRYFILAIFLIALSLPAVAVATPSANVAAASEDCHGMASPDQTEGEPKSDVRLHGCIGCVVPTEAVQQMASRSAAAFIPAVAAVRPLSGISPRPGIRPPRH
jgi:hypothetical protein